MSSVNSIKVSLANEEQWREFHPETEMIVTKTKGRVLFPHLDFRITGLDAEAFYTIHLHLERTDQIKYKFEDGEWKEAAKGDDPLPIQYTEHPNGTRNGQHWMSQTLSFETLKITNDPKNENSNLVLVQSMHKYRPVLTITRHGEEKGEEFRVDLTEFIVVTKYYNVACKEKKVELNKRASGFRENGKRGKKRQSEEVENEDPKRPSPCSSTSSSPNTSNHSFGASPPPNMNLSFGSYASPAQLAPQYTAYPNQFYHFSASFPSQPVQHQYFNSAPPHHQLQYAAPPHQQHQLFLGSLPPAGYQHNAFYSS